MMSGIKYRLNHNPVRYDALTRTYQVGMMAFDTYKDARANKWQCDKCGSPFSSFKHLRAHKAEEHSY